MNTLTITKKLAIATAVLGFAFSVHASNEANTAINYQQALANLIAAQGIQVMHEVSSTVEQSIHKNLSEFSFSNAFAWAEETQNNTTLKKETATKNSKFAEE